MSHSLERGMEIVRLLAERPRSLGDLAEIMAVHRSTVLRLLRSLETYGFARRTDGSLWTVGYGLIAAAHVALEAGGVRESVHEELLALSRELGHTIHLAQVVDDHIIYVDKVEGIGALRMHSRVGTPVLLHTAGVAKAVLAFMPEQERARLLSGHVYERFTDTTISGAEDYQAELVRTRRRGWALDNGEHEEFINCVALPIVGKDGRVRAALSITALRVLADLEALEAYLPRLELAAHSIGNDLGWSSRGVATGDGAQLLGVGVERREI